MERDWGFLPKNVLDVIVEKLVSASTFLRFSVVCKAWFSVAMDHASRRCGYSEECPFLLVPTFGSSHRKRALYDMPGRRRLRLQLEVPRSTRSCGSSRGWLAFVEPDLSVTLLNPFTAASIGLPPFKDWFPECEFPYQILKLVLSADPTTHEKFQVAAIVWRFEQYVALLNFGDEQYWTYFDLYYPILSDLIYYRGRVYGCSHDGGVFSFRHDGSDRRERKTVVPADQALKSPRIKTYLAESTGGELLLFVRFTWGGDVEHWTEGFGVYRITKPEEEEGRAERVAVETLEGDVAFLGESHSMCLRAADFPQCRPDTIYFTDNCYYDLFYTGELGPADNGCFNLEDKKVSRPYDWDVAHKDQPPAIWILPTPYLHN